MQQEQIRETLATKFDRLNSLLIDLRSQAREMKHEIRAQWELELAELERQNRAARSKLSQFSSNSAEAWETFKSGMESTWLSLKKTCEDSRKKFESTGNHPPVN